MNMGKTSFFCAYALSAFVCLAGVSRAIDVCVVGYIMDTFCIERGTLLDNPGLKTLERPDAHSVHCLVDVPRCYESGFEVLVLPAAPAGGKTYCRAMKLDANGNAAALKLARDMGKAGSGCTTCTGTKGNLERGFRATISGTVDLSVTSGIRTIVTSSVLPASVGCGTANVTDPCSLSPDSFSSSANGWVIAHGTLMVTSWGLLLPAGVLIAHFLRYRDPLWFLIHRAVQCTGVCLALSGFIIAVTQFSVFHPGYFAVAQAHGYMGCIVMTIGFLQPINAYFRPHKSKEHPRSEKRKYWEWLHKGSGWFAICLAIPTICIGTVLAGGDLSLPFQILYAVFIALLLTIIFLLIQDRKKYIALEEKFASTEIS